VRPVDAALEELQGHAGTQFHPQVVDALARIVARERDTGSPWFLALETRINTPVTGSVTRNQAPAASEDAAMVWQLTQQLRETGDLAQLLTMLAATTAKLISCAGCAVLLLDERGSTLSVEATTSAEPAPGTVFPRSRSPLWQAVEQRAIQRTGEHSGVVVPLVAGGQAVGLTGVIGLAAFNAQHGYDAGDDLIRRTGELLAANVRQVDFPARLVGGTLALLMPEVDRVEAERAVRRLQAMVNEREVTILGRFMRAQPLR